MARGQKVRNVIINISEVRGVATYGEFGIVRVRDQLDTHIRAHSDIEGIVGEVLSYDLLS